MSDNDNSEQPPAQSGGSLLKGALLALVALIVLVEPEETTPDGPVDLVDVRPEDVERLHLITDEGALTAERSAEGWHLVEPWRTLGNDGAVRSFAVRNPNNPAFEACAASKARALSWPPSAGSRGFVTIEVTAPR